MSRLNTALSVSARWRSRTTPGFEPVGVPFYPCGYFVLRAGLDTGLPNYVEARV
jgi:hypothetical protein